MENSSLRTSLVTQWLIICASAAGAQVQSLVGELRLPHASGCGHKEKRQEENHIQSLLSLLNWKVGGLYQGKCPKAKMWELRIQ